VAALQASLEQARANLDEANARRRDLENQMAPLKERAEQVIRWREESARMTERVETMEKSIRDGTFYAFIKQLVKLTFSL